MLNTKEFGQELKKLGFEFFSGVPCSFLSSLINYAINDCRYVMAANEGDAVAICAGAYLGGQKSVFLCQNSGLTNASSPLTSLNHIFRLPVLGFVSLRGEEGIGDEPQHELMGPITTGMLDLMEITWEYLSADVLEAKEQLARANKVIEGNQTFFFVVKKGTFEKEPLKERKHLPPAACRLTGKNRDDAMPRRIEALAVINALKDDKSVLLATTGFTGRELYEVEDADQNLYMVGSMGCISSLALGLATVREDKDIIAIDGDGSLLMRMGSLATNAFYRPSNILHILLDNNVHESTGGQFTVSSNVDFTGVAASAGYPNVIYAHDLAELEQQIASWQKHKSLTFIYLRTAIGQKENLGRPKIKPYQVKERLMKFLGV